MADFTNSSLKGCVLIPILMDYPLGVATPIILGIMTARLNPYSNGLPSRGSALPLDRRVLLES